MISTKFRVNYNSYVLHPIGNDLDLNLEFIATKLMLVTSLSYSF